MSQRKHQLVTGEYYHIYNRGNSKKEIFHDDDDYRYFINLFNNSNTESRTRSIFIKEKVRNDIKESENIISIGAYTVMPNHFHILVKQEKDGGISLFMQKVLTAYSMYYNKKYKHTGGLFEGKFKSKYAGEDRYLKYLFSYIHLNCLKLLDKDWKKNTNISTREKINFLIGYKWSSFDEYYRGEEIIVNKKAFPKYFSNGKDFLKEIFSWITLDEDGK